MAGLLAVVFPGSSHDPPITGAHLHGSRFRLLAGPDLWSGAFTHPQGGSIRAPLIYVDGPCLLLIYQDSPDHLRLSISDIKLNLSDHPGLARNRTIVLAGTWRMNRATAGVHLRPDGENTILTFLVSHGQSFNVALERVSP